MARKIKGKKEALQSDKAQKHSHSYRHNTDNSLRTKERDDSKRYNRSDKNKESDSHKRYQPRNPKKQYDPYNKYRKRLYHR